MSGCDPVYWDIWASIACAVHSGAAWLIFSSRLFTWKQSDWICLSQVGSGSRADGRETHSREPAGASQIPRLEKIRLTLKVHDAVDLVDKAVHTALCDHLGGDFLCLRTEFNHQSSLFVTLLKTSSHRASGKNDSIGLRI